MGLFNNSSLPDAFSENSNKTIPTVIEMSSKALSLFEHEKKYLLMIEAGQIDWAAHQNDAGLLLAEMLKFEMLLHHLLEYIKMNSDVSLLIVSDHETGGFSFSYRSKNTLLSSLTNRATRDFIQEKHLRDLFKQKISLVNAAKLIENENKNKTSISRILRENFNFEPNDLLLEKLSNEKEVSCPNKGQHYLYPESPALCFLREHLDKKRGIVWSTGTHTTSLVPYLMLGDIKNSGMKPRHLTDVGRLLRSYFND